MTRSRSGKQDAAETYERRNRTEAIGGAGSLAAEALARAGFRDPALVLRWREIVGAEVAQFSRPFRFSEGPSGGTLTLKAEPAAAVFLQHQSRTLCERINRFAGRDMVTRLRFVEGPLAHPEPPAGLPRVPAEMPADDPARRFAGPDSLKAALQALARARQRPRRD